MSRKLRTLVVTLAASSFSSLEPGAAFCLSRPAIVSLAARTAWVPGPVFAAGPAWAWPGAGPAGAGALGWATATEDPSARARTARDRATMGTPPETPERCSLGFGLGTANRGVEFT